VPADAGAGCCVPPHEEHHPALLQPGWQPHHEDPPEARHVLQSHHRVEPCEEQNPSLPNEMSNCTQLESIDISANSFVQLPPVLAEIRSLNKVNASKNFIADVEIEAMLSLGNLVHVNLEENPINKPVYEELAKITAIRVVLSPREQEDWEDLSI